jgi:hypothetical protein
MSGIKSWDVIFLNKRNSNLDNDWVYYRLRSLGDRIADCRRACYSHKIAFTLLCISGADAGRR